MLRALTQLQQFLKSKWEIPSQVSEDIRQRFASFQAMYASDRDPFGLNMPKTCRKMELLYPLYRDYFKVKVHGAQHLENYPSNKPLMVVSNHSGQIAIDGMLLTMAFALDVNPPRFLRSMVERFINTIPFFGTWVAESGAVLGDRSNCLYLLNRGESILVFPEGVKGIAKSRPEYYEVQDFTSGFFRMALGSGVDILPVAVVGAEEFYPWVYQARGLAKLLKLPALPLAPNLLLGPLGALPLPSPIDVHIGPIYSLPQGMGSDDADELVDAEVEKIRRQIQALLNKGLKKRRPFFANLPQKNGGKA